MTPGRVLTIAGSDSGAGAGVQADLKAIAALRGYGTCAITAVTAQNTLGVADVHRVGAATVRAQIDAVMEDIGTDAAKTGMLWDAEIIETVADSVRRHRIERLVVDPVMVATSGDRLLREDAEQALSSLLIPIASLITPNVQEAAALCGRDLETMGDVRSAARQIAEELGARAVVVTGGIPGGPSTDVLYAGGETIELTGPRIETASTHGTGCTFSAAAAVGLAAGQSTREAVANAKRYVTGAISAAYRIGSGHGPVNHFYETAVGRTPDSGRG